MNVLVDRHHAGLFHSMQLLARRLGWTLYTPIGHEWWDADFWSFGRYTYNDDRLALQYLMAEQKPDGEYPDWPINFVTLDDAHSMSWDYVIATLQDNQGGFFRFAKSQGAQSVVQVGNTGQNIEWAFDPLVLSSSEMPLTGRGIVMHQELADVFRYRPPSGVRTVRCFVHLLHETGCFPLWQQFRSLVTDWPVVRYGHPPTFDDPSYVENAKPISYIADLMTASAWGWHDKPHGDGFGHVIHSWAAIGRPLIGHASHYRGKLAEGFWQHGVTCLDLDRISVEEAAHVVQTITPERHESMCRAIRAEFEKIDYDAEADQIAEFLGVKVAA